MDLNHNDCPLGGFYILYDEAADGADDVDEDETGNYFNSNRRKSNASVPKMGGGSWK